MKSKKITAAVFGLVLTLGLVVTGCESNSSKADDSAIARNEDVLEISKRLLEQNKEAF